MKARNRVVLVMGLLLLSSGPATVLASEDPGAPNADAASPYSGIERYLLPNGVKVILAPSSEAGTVQVKVRARAGMFNDPPGGSGTAHLLEHYLFTSANLAPDMTYLEAIQERGGKANAITDSDRTEYFATVPPRLSRWIVSLYGQMLARRTFSPLTLQNAKGPVSLEIGPTGPLDYPFAAHAWINGHLALFPDFWETEFGVRDPVSSRALDRLELWSLTAGDVENFYHRYYQPGNLVFFIAGRFDPAEARKDIAAAFGSIPVGPVDGWREPAAQPRERPYYRSAITSDTPYVEVGAKVSSLSVRDEVAAQVYLHWLAHRLMKELRNQKGQTYTVNPLRWLRNDFGRMTVEFESAGAGYRSNLARAKELLEQEATQGQITDAGFREAVSLYRDTFELKDRDSHSRLRASERLEELDERAEATVPPGRRLASAGSSTPEAPEAVLAPLDDYQAFSALTADSFRASLRRVFDRSHAFEKLDRPPFLFRYEAVFLVAIAFLLWSALARALLIRPFEHDQVRWVRKLGYPPAGGAQVGVGVATLVLGFLGSALLQRAWLATGLASAGALFSDYVFLVGALGAGVFIFHGLLAILPRKAMVVGADLCIKSLGYRSVRVPLSELVRAETVSPGRLLLRLVARPALIPRLGLRWGFLDPHAYREGLWLECRDGRAWFLGFEDSAKVRGELAGLVPSLR